MKKILFLYDTASSRPTLTADDFHQVLPDVEIVSLDGLQPTADALTAVLRLCGEEKPDIVVGEGIGGMLAQQVHGYHKVLVNPSFFLPNGLCSGNEDFVAHQFDGITEFDKENTYAYFTDGDDLVVDYDLYHDYYPIGVHYPTGQGIEPKYVMKLIFPLVREILKLQ